MNRYLGDGSAADIERVSAKFATATAVAFRIDAGGGVALWFRASDTTSTPAGPLSAVKAPNKITFTLAPAAVIPAYRASR